METNYLWTTDKETDEPWDIFIIWIFISGLFWAVGAAEKKNPNCHNYATFEVSFLMFSWQIFYFIFLNIVKPSYFNKQRSSASFLLTLSRYIGPKWPWSLSRLVPCLNWMELDCQVLLGHFGPVYLLQVSKKDDEEHCFLK